MKRLFLFVISVLALSSCTFYDVEPRYDSRDHLVGTYQMKEYSETYNDYTYYSIYISKSNYSAREIYFDNFYAADIRIYAVLEFDKLRIPHQVVDGYEVEGVGTIQGSDLSLNYRVKDLYSNTYTDFCETTAWRYY